MAHKAGVTAHAHTGLRIAAIASREDCSAQPALVCPRTISTRPHLDIAAVAPPLCKAPVAEEAGRIIVLCLRNDSVGSLTGEMLMWHGCTSVFMSTVSRPHLKIHSAHSCAQNDQHRNFFIHVCLRTPVHNYLVRKVNHSPRSSSTRKP